MGRSRRFGISDSSEGEDGKLKASLEDPSILIFSRLQDRPSTSVNEQEGEEGGRFGASKNDFQV